MKKVMILAVAAALLGLAAPNTMAQVPGSSQPSSSSSSTTQDDDLNQQTPSSTTTQPGTSGSTGTSGTSGSSDQYGTSGSQSGSQSGTSGSSGSMGTSGTSSSTSMEYKEEVKISDLPAAVTRTINETYPGYKTEKAFRANDGTYKVKVSKGDETQTLFFDERGQVVKMKK